jgi:hypothetical protein
VQGLNDGLVFVVAQKELDIGKAHLDWHVRVGVGRAEDVLAVSILAKASGVSWMQALSRRPYVPARRKGCSVFSM